MFTNQPSPSSASANAAAPPIRLAVDLDGVLTEHPRPLATAASTRFGLDLPERAFVDSAGLNVPDAVRDWVYGAEGPAKDLRPAPGAIAFLERVRELVGPRNVVIITARPSESAELTLGWLRAHGFPTIEVLFGDDKVAIAAGEEVTIAIEDSARHARNYAAAGITCFLLTGEPPEVETPTPDVNGAERDPRIIRVRDLVTAADQITAALTGADPRAALTTGRPLGDAVPRTSSSVPLGPPPERPVIVVSDQIHPLAWQRLSVAADLREVAGTDLPALRMALAEADALVVRSETQVTAEVIAAAPRLRIIARAGVGVDNIDLAAATAAGILVLNAPGANSVSAGEHTIALLLSLTRQVPMANERLQAGHWERKGFTPVDLRGRVAGIIGLGHVGSIVAKRLKAFDMDVIAHDPFITQARFAELDIRPVSLDELYATSDVITFHVPVTSRTIRMLDAETIAKLKPGVIVINAARGEIVDQEALATALTSGQVAAAGVDVFPHEPCVSSPLFGLPNVVVTPHIGGSSVEALAAIGEVISTTTLAALRGEAVPNAVNLPAASLEAPALRRLATVSAAVGRLLAVLSPEPPSAFRLTVEGQVPADVTEHVLGAALSEALQSWANQRVTAVNARLIAGELGIAMRVVQDDNDPDRVPEFSFTAAGDPPHRVTIRWDRVTPRIIEVDRFPFDRGLAGDVMITHHTDQPGMIGQLGTILGRYGVNIAGMQVGRHTPRGEAIMVLNVDDPIPPDALEEIRGTSGIGTVYVVSLPPAEDEPEQLTMPTGELIGVGGG